MSLIRFIIFAVAFYFLFKVIRYLFRYLISSENNRKSSPGSNNSGSRADTKYRNIEEAKYTEIESEPRRDSSTTQK